MRVFPQEFIDWVVGTPVPPWLVALGMVWFVALAAFVVWVAVNGDNSGDGADRRR